MRSRVRVPSLHGYFRSVLGAGLALACAQTQGASQDAPECSPPVDAGAALSRDPSPLLNSDESEGCRIDQDGRLGRACLPRCSTPVRAPFYACRDQGCEDSVLATDQTLGADAFVEGGSTVLDCIGCVRAARNFCLARACPDESARRAACAQRSDGNGCAAEFAALGECFFNRQHLYEPCWFLAVETCFSGR